VEESRFTASENYKAMMSTMTGRAPHMASRGYDAPNAALLIDFDNVTMGIRSDLGKELKTLLNSDLIRGKVAVQRAYADWRRYPQYIVPLSEASVDLIFAPAYGSSKKNATDLRMAIDGMELVFTRPEIGTYILLTGDSDFSSLVLKLKEYGKYVIGVGMKESSSDILVQNCDEYYSYHSLSGLTKTGEGETPAGGEDPWKLVEKALERMVSNNDVMRSDRLKQVMLELDSGFDEKKLGYSKFSRFMQDAAQRGLVGIRKLENGQHEIIADGAGVSEGNGKPDRGRRGGRSSRGGRQEAAPTRRAEPPKEIKPEPEASKPEETAAAPSAGGVETVEQGFRLLQDALREMDARGKAWARDADVKRKMLESVPDFDEGKLGFSKFSRFLQKAHDAEMVDLERMEGGSYQVVLGEARAKAEISQAQAQPAEKAEQKEAAPAETKKEAPRKEAPRAEEKEEKKKEAPTAPSAGTDKIAARAARRTRSRRGGAAEGAPVILPGQIVGTSKPDAGKAPAAEAGEEKSEAKPSAAQGKAAPKKKAPAKKAAAKKAPAEKAPAAGDAIAELGLPSDADSIVSYLTNSYKGVGKKTAEKLTEAFGDKVFEVFESSPDRVKEVLTPGRATALLEQWEADRERRGKTAPAAKKSGSSSRGRSGAKGGKSSGGGKKKSA